MSTFPARLAARLWLVLALAAIVLAMVPAVAAATVTVHIRETLDPKTLTIAPGTSVRWVNESDNRYRMRSRSGPEEFDSGNLEPGESFTFTFRLGGTYPYLDDRERDDADFHGTVIVRAAGDATPTPLPSSGGTPAPPPAGQPAAPSTATVHMAGEQFSPSAVAIAIGGQVTFLNDDDREHTATATGGAFNTGVLAEGGRSTKTFTAAGTFPFLCAIHPDMTGTVTVRSASGSAPPPAATPRPTLQATPRPAPSSSPASGGTGTGGSGGGAASAAEVTIVDFAFDAPTVEIRAGGSVTWRNDGAAPHTVAAGDASFDSGLLVAGGTFERRFEAAGRYAYVCTFHPEMQGTISVVAAPTGGPVEPSGGLSSAPPSPTATPSVATSPAATASPAATGEAGPIAAGGPITGEPPPDTATASTGSGAEGAVRALVALILVGLAGLVFAWLVRGLTAPPASPIGPSSGRR